MESYVFQHFGKRHRNIDQPTENFESKYNFQNVRGVFENRTVSPLS